MILVFVLYFAIYNGKGELVVLLCFFFLVSRDCCVALTHDAMVCLQLVIVVFPDFTHLLFLL